MAYRLGVDVGGTFTDLLLVDEASHELWRVKVPSTPADPSIAVVEGVRRILATSGAAAGRVAVVQHGTTVATNAVLEGKGARVGLITTRGFGQILHLARSQTPGPLAGWIIMIKPEPPAALEDTREADERISARGEVVRAVRKTQVRRIVRELVSSGVESLTVSLINSYTNPSHEREIGRIIEELYPGFSVTLSSNVLPEFREYERTLTACMNSYVRPKVAGYVRNLETSLQREGVRGEINILRSDAGLMSTQVARENPIYGILSGPAGGVAGALAVARRAGLTDILTFDMGGTSTDVALCQDGQPGIARETELGYFRVKVPSVNVHSVGAGGGSIAHVPQITGALRVGPQSAGADPGPACYGKGGREPTVSDANVVVGHLPPLLLGGEMRLDAEAAEEAVAKVGAALGLDVHQAAEGILAIVNENIAGALRLVSVQRGYDPRSFALVAFGGAGPMHANAVAKLMGSYPVLVPPAPGLLCATGDLVADFREEFARTLIRTLDRLDLGEVLDLFAELGREATAWMDREKIRKAARRVTYHADLRYYRQGYEIPVVVDPKKLRSGGLGELAASFEALHEQYYGYRMDDTPHEIVNLRAVAIGEVPHPRLPEASDEDGPASGHALVDDGHRIYSAGTWLRAPVFDRGRLRWGNRIAGPAVVTEFDATTVVLAGFEATVDRHFNLLLRPAGR
jgi:N-methylhydantoinase A